MKLTDYICTASKDVRNRIAHALMKAGIEGIDFELAMNGRLCDLADTIEIGGLI